MAEPLGEGDIASVQRLLTEAVSHDGAHVQRADAAIQSLETRVGFCSCLAEVVGRRDVEHSVRFLAATTLKNVTGRYWRTARQRGGVADEEKAHLRRRLMQLSVEPETSIALQVAVTIGRVARFDYPRDWPTLLTDLLGSLQSNDMDILRERRVYLVLHHVLKELASKRLMGDQQTFYAICQDIFQYVWTLWCQYTENVAALVPSAAANPEAAREVLPKTERWLLLLKVLRRLLVHGFPSDARTLQDVPAVGHAAPVLLQAFQALLPARMALASQPSGSVSAAQVVAMLDRGVLKIVKSLKDIQEAHPWSFRLNGALAVVSDSLISHVESGHQELPGQSGNKVVYEHLLISSMLFLHQVATCKAYARASAGLPLGTGAEDAANERGAAMCREANEQIAAVWSRERKTSLLVALVERYLPLGASDIHEMAHSPEQFQQDSEAGAWQECLRPCAEALCLALLESDREGLAPVILTLLQRSAEACPLTLLTAPVPPSVPTVHGVPVPSLFKEAVYNAVGWSSYELHDFIDLSGWLRSTLLAEASNPAPHAVPVRRRGIIVLGQWVAKLTKEDRVAVYKCLVDALNSGVMSVQLAAVQALRLLVDDWGFYIDDFQAFIGPTLEALLRVLRAADEFETQVQVFNLLCVIVERAAEDIAPYAGAIIGVLPEIWDDAEDQALLRMQVVEVLQKLVNALGDNAVGTYGVVIPVLSYALDMNNKDSLTLVEDALQLWLSCLRNALSPTWPLLDLFPRLEPICASTTEHVRAVTQVAQSCMLLGRSDFFARHGASLNAVISSLVGAVNERGMMLLIPTLDLALKLYQADATNVLLQPLSRLLGSVLAGREETTVVAASFDVFARIVLQGPHAADAFFAQAADRLRADLGGDLAGQAGPSGREVMDAFLEQWLESFDAISRKRSRKLAALALATLCGNPGPEVLRRLDVLVAHVTGVLAGTEGAGAEGDAVQLGYEVDRRGSGAEFAQGYAGEEAQGEFQRRQWVYENDLATTASLSQHLRAQLTQGLQGPAGAELTQALGRLDPNIAAVVQRVMARPS